MAPKKRPAKKPTPAPKAKRAPAPVLITPKKMAPRKPKVVAPPVKKVAKKRIQARRVVGSLEKVAKYVSPPPITTKSRGEKFVENYLVTNNATKAAIAAGVSEASAGTIGARMLSDVEIRNQLSDAKGAAADRLGISVEKVIDAIDSIAFSNMLDYTRVTGDGSVVVDLSTMTRKQAAAISEITVEEYIERTGPDDDDVERVKRTKFKLHPKLPALEKLAMHRGIKGFGTSKLEVSGPDGGPVPIMSPSQLHTMTMAQLEMLASTPLDLPDGVQIEGKA